MVAPADVERGRGHAGAAGGAAATVAAVLNSGASETVPAFGGRPAASPAVLRSARSSRHALVATMPPSRRFDVRSRRWVETIRVPAAAEENTRSATARRLEELGHWSSGHLAD